MAPQISTDKASYTVGAEGGDVVVKLLSTQDWTASVAPGTSLDVVDDITVEPSEGKGSSEIVEVTVKVPANTGVNRKATVSFLGSTLSGAVTIEQEGEEGERLLTCTIAEFIAKPVDASVYYVLTGVVANSTTPTTYSNFNLRDPETGDEVYIYGLARKEDVTNQKIGLLAELGIEEGDTITIASTRGEYNGTIEGLNSYYISHKKSEAPMIKLGSNEVTAAKGSTFELAVSSNLVTWTLSADVDWLTFEPASSNKSETVIVSVAEDGEGTEGVITLAAEGLESLTCKVTRTDIMDITVADFLAAEVGDKPYRLVGKIESIVSDKYGNFYLADATGRVYVYGLTATPVAKNDQSFGSLELRAGDIVTIVGTRGQYAGAKVDDQKEQVSGAYFESAVKSTDVTVAEFLTKEVASKYLESAYYRLTGIVKEIVSQDYGNLYLKEVDSDTYVYVYGVTAAPVAKNDKSFGTLGIKAGDKLTIVGQRGQYANAKVEDQKDQVSNGYFISVEAGDTPVPGDELTVEAAAVEVAADVVKAEFSVKSNLDWTVTKSEGDWVSKFTESGSNDGVITVEFEANEGEARTAKFAVAAGELKVELTLTQKAADVAPVPEYKTLAELNAAIVAGGEEGIEFVLNLTKPAVVTRVCSDNKTTYVQDETAGLMYYGSPIEGAVEGVTFTGKISGVGVMYNGLPEVTYADFSAATVGVTTDIPCFNLTLADLAADFDKYINAKVKLTNVEVSDAFSSSDKDGKVKQGDNELAVYVKTRDTFEVGLGTIGDAVLFPAVYGTTKQAFFWDPSDFKTTVEGGEITLNSSFTVNVGETVELKATTNSTATIKYLSADEAIATVSAEGVVTGVKEGTVEITASIDAVDGFTAAEAKTTVTVKPAGSAAPECVYSLVAAKGLNSAYANSGDIEIDGITWSVNGNMTLTSGDAKTPIWRIGGKSLTDTDRTIYSKGAIAQKVSKIDVTHFAKGANVTVNSMTISVYDNAKDAANGENAVSSVGATYVDNGVTTFEVPEGQDWTGKYYRIVYNLSVSGSKNQGVDFQKAEFWK